MFLFLSCSPQQDSTPADTIRSLPDCSGYNVILITLDTVRADHLPFHGYPVMTAPNLSRMAQNSIQFKDAIAQSTWTLPSHASILSGMYPHEHGAIKGNTRIAPDVPMLPQFFKEAGYSTAAFISHYFVHHQFGFGKGFDHFDTTNYVRDMAHVSTGSLTGLAVDWMDAQPGEFFVWIHNFDPHNQFVHHDKIDFEYIESVSDEPELQYDKWNSYPCEFSDFFNSAREKYISLHDGEIYRCDRAIGNLMRYLQSRDLLDKTIVIITSDHGEAFMDHGLVGHGTFVYSEVTDVPLLVYLPGSTPGIVRPVTELKNIVPTLLDLFGMPKPQYLGRNILTENTGHAFSDVLDRQDHRSICFVSDEWKLVYSYHKDEFELYDRRTDPGDLKDVARFHPDIVTSLKPRLMDLTTPKIRPAAPDTQQINHDELTTEHLKALGYVEK